MDFIVYDNKFVPRPCGFVNTGSICWLNTLVQNLVSLSSFNYILKNVETKNKTVILLRDVIFSNMTKCQGVLDITRQLNQHIVEYAANRRDRIIFGNGQQCAAEGFNLLLEMLATPEIDRLFTHRYRHNIICGNCSGIVSSKREENTLFEIEPEVFARVSEDMLMSDFLKLSSSPTFDYKCPSCGDDSPKRRYSELTMVPEILGIMIKRYRVVDGMPSKINFNINFPLMLKFRSKSAIGNGDGSEFVYRLMSSVEHSGGVNSGHYWAQCFRDGWYNINDSIMTKIIDFASSDSTYIVFYHIVKCG